MKEECTKGISLESRTYTPATRPTMYFIGVTTGMSSIMKVFPGWAEYLGFGDCELKGIDFKPHADPAGYREAVQFIMQDPLSLGSLVTTHKLDLLAASRDLFDELDPYAQLLGEVSGIVKRNGRLIGYAKDPITSGLSLEAIVHKQYWSETGAELLLLGAGGSSVALSAYLLSPERGNERPSRIVVTNRSARRLDEMKAVHAMLPASVPIEYHLTPDARDNDEALRSLKPYSVVINATGLGKDVPGSPLTDAAVFPEHGIAWDFNYRGDLVFLDQARAQQAARGLTIEDGWVYFIHGWTRVIEEVFSTSIPVSGKVFDDLSDIAAKARR